MENIFEKEFTLGKAFATYSNCAEKPEHEYIKVIAGTGQFSGIADRTESNTTITSVVARDGSIKPKYAKSADKLYFTLYGYIHSGVAISTKPFGCKWDSGILGFIEIDKSKVRDIYECTRINKRIIEKIGKEIEDFTEALNHYVNGEVYEVTLEYVNFKYEPETFEILGYSNLEKYFENLK